MESIILNDRLELRENFGFVEYVVFALVLLLSVAIGIYFWYKGQKNMEEFLLGGRKMGVFPMSISLAVR